MIEICHTLLNKDTLNNLMIDVITREATDYGEFEIQIENKKAELLEKLDKGEAIIVYCTKEETCHIISLEKLLEIKRKEAHE